MTSDFLNSSLVTITAMYIDLEISGEICVEEQI